MTQSDDSNQTSQAEARKARLAAQLRANLARRKAQTRARRRGDADLRNGMDAPPGTRTVGDVEDDRD